MTVSTFIGRMRARQADLFDTSVAVARVTAAGVFNEATASHGAPTSATVFTGRALVRPDRTTVVEAGGTSTGIDGFLVKLPVDTAVRVGDVVTVTDSLHDAGLVGRTLRVLEVQPDEWQVCRRAFCVDQQARPT